MTDASVDRCPIKDGVTLYPREWRCCECGWPARSCAAFYPEGLGSPDDFRPTWPYQLAMDFQDPKVTR